MGLGGWERVLGTRFMLITTKGRKTGRPHSVMVDVLDHDSKNDTYYIESEYGTRADWFRNMRANPVFEIQVGHRRFSAQARRVPGPQAAEILSRYIGDHELYAGYINRMIGTDIKSFKEEELLAMGRDFEKVNPPFFRYL